ncbi:MAG: type II and III secretion system protein family protein [Candidatus Paracaedimonas acanthamoebae]|uniref:Type II and III secretion system protein family protein n=1 Tax=Candidatus Paracaedimonas acanthamoebae TaxID=244581 RepID=A0A8J7TU60_9PROT|nr:type II and III secretion system protein family protein [Candidatus Paracaedimonas acanthamoebae]
MYHLIKAKTKLFIYIVGFTFFINNVYAIKEMIIEQNVAETIHLEDQVTEVFVANPEIADVQLNNPRVAYVFGNKPGVTTIFATNKEGKLILQLQLKVTHNLAQLNQTLKALYPYEDIQTISTPGGVVLNGKISTPETAKKIVDVAAKHIGTKDNIINNLQIGTKTQVLLKVKIAEVRRSTLNKLNINWSSAINSPAHFTYGLMTGRAPIVNGVFDRNNGIPQLSSVGAGFNDGVSNFSALIDALDQEGLGTILAEPNLIAVSGETASFLAGGEFPFPVPQDTNITIEFKQFGISLAFTPTVLSGNSINLRVRPEVSELDDSNALAIPVGTSSAPVRVPALKTRRAETSVELGSGQSLAIAGLITASTANAYSQLPGFGDIPVLGALFRSTDFKREQSELVIIVTPYIVEPNSDPKALQLPTDGIKYASNLETLFMKRLNRKNVRPDQDGKEISEHQLFGVAGFNVE